MFAKFFYSQHIDFHEVNPNLYTQTVNPLFIFSVYLHFLKISTYSIAGTPEAY